MHVVNTQTLWSDYSIIVVDGSTSKLVDFVHLKCHKFN